LRNVDNLVSRGLRCPNRHPHPVAH
jgi:hypothetical protein